MTPKTDGIVDDTLYNIRCMNKNKLIISRQDAHNTLAVNGVHFVNSSPVFIPCKVKYSCK